MHKSNSRGASPQPLDHGPHAIDARPARRRGGARSTARRCQPFRVSRRCTRLNVISTQVTTCKCGKPVTFEAVPCGCRLACDKCAMKLVRLPVVSMRRVVDASPSRRRPAASAGTARSGTAACGASSAARRRRSDSGGFCACALCSVRPCSTTSTPPPRPRRDGVSRSYF